MNIYLSGPITGHEDTAEQRFREAAEVLEAMSTPTREIKVWNPVDHCPPGVSRTWAMWYDLRALLDAKKYYSTYADGDVESIRERYFDAVVLMDGWEKSEGCAVEEAVARAVGIPTMTFCEAVAGGLEGLR